MAVTILGFPLLIVLAVALAIVMYTQTKSWKKVAYSFEILISLAVFVLSAKLPHATLAEQSLQFSIILLSVGLLINGVFSFFKK